MSTRAWLVDEAVGEYIAAHTSPADPVVAEIRTATEAVAGRMAMMQIGDDQSVFMELLARATGRRGPSRSARSPGPPRWPWPRAWGRTAACCAAT